MNTFKKIVITTALLHGATQAMHDEHRVWLQIARDCENDSVPVNYNSLKRTDFALRDEDGKNIYQIALEKHKATSSIACAKMAVMIEYYGKRIHEELKNELTDLEELSEKLEEVEKTFEVSHKS